MPFVRRLLRVLGGVLPLALLLAPASAQAQRLYVPGASNLLAMKFASVDAGDFDGDGQLDLVLTGTQASGVATTRIVRFVSAQVVFSFGQPVRADVVYTPVPMQLPGLGDGVARWGDYDQDGDLDLLLVGLREAGSTLRSADLYRNDAGTLVLNAQAGLPPLSLPAAAWGDYDQDGDLDLVLAGETGSGRILRVYRNDAGRFTDIGAGLEGLLYASLAWGDYDKDGDLDLAATGVAEGQRLVARIYRNDAGRFTDIGAGLRRVHGGSLAWGDYDKDGDLDLLLTGGVFDPAMLRGWAAVYRNDGGAFVPVEVDAEGGAVGPGAFGDYDKDGDLDVVLAGPRFGLDIPYYRFYENQGGRFSLREQSQAPNLSSLLLFDVNGDGYLEALGVGEQGGVARLGFEFNVTGAEPGN